jgi:hypothetical protein
MGKTEIGKIELGMLIEWKQPITHHLACQLRRRGKKIESHIEKTKFTPQEGMVLGDGISIKRRNPDGELLLEFERPNSDIRVYSPIMDGKPIAKRFSFLRPNQPIQVIIPTDGEKIYFNHNKQPAIIFELNERMKRIIDFLSNE